MLSPEIVKLQKKFKSDMTEEEFNELSQTELLSIKGIQNRKQIIKKCFEIWQNRVKNGQKIIEFDVIQSKFLKNLPNHMIKVLFYGLAISEQIHPHKSGWIRFDLEEVEEIVGQKLSYSDFCALQDYGITFSASSGKMSLVTVRTIQDLLEYNSEEDHALTYVFPLSESVSMMEEVIGS